MLEDCLKTAWRSLEDFLKTPIKQLKIDTILCHADGETDRATPWAPVGAEKRKLMSSLCEIFPCSKYSDIFYFRIFADSVHWKIAWRWKFLSGVFLYTNTFINIKYFSVEKIFKILNISISIFETPVQP